MTGHASTPNNGGATYEVAFFRSVTDTHPRTETLTWDSLSSKLSTHKFIERKIDAELFSPVTYKPGTTRAAKNVEQVNFISTDLDNGTAPQQVSATLEQRGLSYALYSTFRSTPDHPKFRVVIPLAVPIPASRWPRVWGAISRELFPGLLDPSTKDAPRLFYLPSAPKGSEPFVYSGSGHPFDASTLTLDPERPPTTSAPIAPAVESSDVGEILRRVRGRSADGPLLAHVLDTSRGEPREHSSNVALAYELYVVGASVPIAAQLLEWPQSQVSSTFRGFADRGAYSYNISKLVESDPILRAARDALAPKPKPRESALDADAVLARLADYREGTELGVSARFAERFSDRLRFDVNSQRWRVKKDGIWPEADKDVTKELARAVLDEVRKDAETCEKRCLEEKKSQGEKHGEDTARGEPCCKYRSASNALYTWAKKSAREGVLNAAIAGAATWPGVQVQNDELDPNDWQLPVRAGVVDLRTGELRPYSDTDLWTWKAVVDPDDGVPITRWLAFLTMLGLSPERIDYVQRVLYYWLTGDVSEQNTWDIWGHGSNGKSTLTGVIAGLVPGAVAYADGRTFANTRSDKIPNDVASLRKKRLILIPEPERGLAINEELVNRWSGGIEEIQARFMRGEWFAFRPKGKLVWYGSEKVRVSGQGTATWRRMKFLKLVSEFPKPGEKGNVRDYHKVLLREEGGGILAWIIAGRTSYAAKGLTPPEEVVADTAAFKEQSDPIGEWLHDCVANPSPGSFLDVEVLHRCFQRWCQIAEEKSLALWSKRHLGEELEERGLVRDPSRKHGRRWREVDLTDQGWETIGQKRLPAVAGDQSGSEERGGGRFDGPDGPASVPRTEHDAPPDGGNDREGSKVASGGTLGDASPLLSPNVIDEAGKELASGAHGAIVQAKRPPASPGSPNFGSAGPIPEPLGLDQTRGSRAREKWARDHPEERAGLPDPSDERVGKARPRHPNCSACVGPDYHVCYGCDACKGQAPGPVDFSVFGDDGGRP